MITNESKLNLLAIIVGEDKYIFFFDDDRLADVETTLERFATDSRLNMTLRDATRALLRHHEARKKDG